MTETAVGFDSEGLRCAADLYLPDDHHEETLPGLVLGHGFGLGKGHLIDQARYFAAAGFATLTIDYRYFGESDGEPRQKNHPLDKAEDYRNAISYLQGRPEVDQDRIGIWGTSFSGGTVVHVAGVDRRVKAVVSQVPVSDGRRWLQILRNPSQWEQLLDTLEEDRRKRFAGEPGGVIPSTGQSGEFAVLPWKGPRDSSMQSAEEMRLSWIEKVIEWRPLAFAAEIAPRPLMVITGSQYDAIHPYAMALEVYEAAKEPKELVALPFEGMSFYGPPGINAALSVAANFYAKHLGLTIDEQRASLLDAASAPA